MLHIARISLIASLASLSACLTTVEPKTDAGAAQPALEGDTITYRDLATHPGCTTDGLATRPAGATNANAYTPAVIPGYKCAAKEYPVQNEDTSKPIVLLIHGNSSTPADYEAYADPNTPGQPTPMLSERLVAAGFKTFAVDMRFDKVDDPVTDNNTANAAKNMDHGWCVPIVQHFIESMMNAYPNREFSIVAFSLGPTVVRDALRRLHKDGKKPFERIKTLVFGSGAHHGVSSYKLCATNPTMRGKVTCEMGDRDHYVQTAFHKPLNGPPSNDPRCASDVAYQRTGACGGAWETPCSDGNSAFGQTGVCGGHKVNYVTIVMQDPTDGTLQDEFVSQTSAALRGATNLTVALSDQDKTGYFVKGAFKDHYGAIRSEAGLQLVMNALSQ